MRLQNRVTKPGYALWRLKFLELATRCEKIFNMILEIFKEN